MAVEIVMPRLGWTMESGSVAEWIKKDGDLVRPGEILFTVETDKVAQEVEAMDGGILRLAPGTAAVPGTEVPVGTVLAYLLAEGEVAPFAQAAAAPALLSADQPPRPITFDVPVADPRANGYRAPAASPRARRVASELGMDWTALAGSGATGRIVERDVRAAAAQSLAARARVTPLARRAAAQAGVDMEELAAKLPGRRITRSDVQSAGGQDHAAPLPPAAEGAPEGAGRRRPMGRARRIIAARMAESAHSVAAVTLTTEADATELAALRERIKRGLAGSGRPVPSYTDLLARLVALALLEHPWMNASLDGEDVVEHDAVHIGIAVDTEHGLLVPVVRDAHRKSVQAIAAESAGLIERARSGKAASGDLGGSTFTITNLGMYEIDAFTPIINLPECAILGMGRIVARQVVTDEAEGTVAIRKMLALSLSFDHRVVDGGPAARFLQQIKRWVEQPYAWLTA